MNKILAVIIPAYNEEKTICAILNKIKEVEFMKKTMVIMVDLVKKA